MFFLLIGYTNFIDLYRYCYFFEILGHSLLLDNVVIIFLINVEKSLLLKKNANEKRLNWSYVCV